MTHVRSNLVYGWLFRVDPKAIKGDTVAFVGPKDANLYTFESSLLNVA